MRIFTAALVTETNTFSPIPTGRDAFGSDGAEELATLARWRERAQAGGHNLVESIGAVAQPAGPTVRHVYEALREQLLDDLRAAAPVDIVLLYLHGAMVAQGYDDCEGDILERVRGIAGDTAVVGAELDLHSHLTDAMLRHATIIAGYDEYPHTDIVSRGESLYRLCMEAALGRTRPVMRAYDCRITGMFPTTRDPMRHFVGELKAARTGSVLSTSLIHGFPWGDVAGGGTKCLAITDGDETLAQETAERFGRKFFAIREPAQLTAMAIGTALDKAASVGGGPVVLADVADNAGGGAPGDSTFILRALLERNVTGAVSGMYYDPQAVQLCFEAGEGATLDLRIGGKLGPASGEPVDLRVVVRAVRESHTQDSMDDSLPVPLGAAAWVDANGVQLVLASARRQVFAPNAFTGLGIDLQRARIVVVKSSHHFYSKFAPIAAEVLYVDSPGALQMDFTNIAYTKRDLNYWPRVPDPFR
ncbi:MAG: M81 family metallopeptidase [Candidatus Baltobacteraceae bacterium]